MRNKQELDDYLNEIFINERICLVPAKWNDLYKFIKIKSGKDDVVKPLILGGWYETPLLVKKLCFQQQLEYAYDNDILESVKIYLSKLSENQWHQVND
jgi:hypothetical protein